MEKGTRIWKAIGLLTWSMSANDLPLGHSRSWTGPACPACHSPERTAQSSGRRRRQLEHRGNQPACCHRSTCSLSSLGLKRESRASAWLCCWCPQQEQQQQEQRRRLPHLPFAIKQHRVLVDVNINPGLHYNRYANDFLSVS